jgi:hypothetical protein
MCDERSASRLSAFNSAKRNGLSAENLIHMAQLHDHWTYGLDAPKSTHSAALHLPKSTPPHAHLAAPTLQDLMNPSSSSDDLVEPTFICDDPYGMAKLDEDEDDEDDSQPIITRGLNVERLEIDKLVDLANPKLVARYSEALKSKGSALPVVTVTPPTAITDKWSDENWVEEEADF